MFNELKKEKGEKTFQCFVEGCDRLCSTPQKRRLHVIDKHGFPKVCYSLALELLSLLWYVFGWLAKY